MTELTRLYPMVQFKKDTWEIDEFDLASMYLLIGSEKAMLIDCGMGVGDLRGAVEMLTDKPLITVISHNHPDHSGNVRQFDEIWINRKELGQDMPYPLEKRRFDTERIAARQKDCIGNPYTMFHLYPYDINVDLREPAPDTKMPVIHELTDGMQFDLGGGRIVTAYECPGHAPGEMVFLDEMTRTLIAGDALNFSLFLMGAPVESALRGLRKIESLKDRYDGIWNGHHDYRAFGAPLDKDCLPTAIRMCEDILAGNYAPVEEPDAWGQKVPLTRQGEKHSWKTTIRRGRNSISFKESNIFEEKRQEGGNR